MAIEIAIGVLVEALLPGRGATMASGGGGGLLLKMRKVKKNGLGTNLKRWHLY